MIGHLFSMLLVRLKLTKIVFQSARADPTCQFHVLLSQIGSVTFASSVIIVHHFSYFHTSFSSTSFATSASSFLLLRLLH